MTDTRTLLIETRKDELQIEIPAKWKVTFGSLQPGQRGYGDEGGCVLRIYETDKQQRAVFRDVVSFRDMAIPVKRKVTEVKAKSKSKRDSKGNSQASESVEVSEGDWEEV